MASRISGITIEIGGDTTKLQSALKGVDSTLRTTQNNLRDINKLLKLDPKNTELLSQKQKQLETAIKSTKDRLKELKDAQSSVSKGTQEWDSLQREIIDTEQKLKGLETEMNNFGSVAAQKIKATGQEFKNFGDKLSGIGKEMTTRITLPLVAAGAAAVSVASDYEENLNKIDVAFGDSADTVKDWANNAMDQFGLSKVAATSAVSGFGALGKGIGLAESDAAEMSVTLAGLSSDLASYFNTGTDESSKALEGIFTGEAEALKKFGVVMNDTNLKQFAEDQGLVYKELSQTEKTMLRYDFVLAKTKDAQGDYARTSDGTANSAKTFKAAIQDLATTFGTELLPIITPIIRGITDFIKKIASLPAPVKKAIAIGGMVLAVIGPIITAIGGLISGIGSIMMFAPMIASAVSAISLPMIGIVAIIAAVVAAGILLYKNWDTIKAKAIEFKDGVVAGWNQLKADTVAAWNNMVTSVVTAWNNLKTSVSTAVETLKADIAAKWEAIKADASAKVEAIKTDVVTKWNTLRATVAGIWNGIKAAISNAINGAVSVVKSGVEKLKNALKFSWSLPHLKVPHISVSGGVPPYGIGGKGSLPQFHVEWYRKAYDNPVLFNSPTVMETPNGLKGFGDGHGAEIVMGLDRLRELVGQGQNVTVNVVLQGDARQMFKVIRQENYTRTRATNWNALGAATT